MKIQKYLALLLLSTAAVISAMPSVYASDRTTQTREKTTITRAYDNPRNAGSDFVEHVNSARVALAMNKPNIAKQHIAQARETITFIKDGRTQERRIKEISSGRIVYQYDTEEKYHYFPVRSGPVYVQQMSSGPLWAANDLAVTDADIVYLTLDFDGDEAQKYLNAADTAVTAGNLKEASSQLAKLTSTVMTVENQVAMPLNKARDNITLARGFIAGENYAGARYALRHADDALNAMEKSDIYKNQRRKIVSMRKDVKSLQGAITKKDPTLLEKADQQMEQWWEELDSWVKNSK